MDTKLFPYTIIDKYYPEENQLRHILLTHSIQVAKKTLQLADNHPELQLDRQFLEEASLLHDIGIFLCDAPGIQCFGSYRYICHGYLGAELMRREGCERHALVCERHTGAGLSLSQIEAQDLPIPHRDMLLPINFSPRQNLLKKSLLNRRARACLSSAKRAWSDLTVGVRCSSKN